MCAQESDSNTQSHTAFLSQKQEATVNTLSPGEGCPEETEPAHLGGMWPEVNMAQPSYLLL